MKTTRTRLTTSAAALLMALVAVPTSASALTGTSTPAAAASPAATSTTARPAAHPRTLTLLERNLEHAQIDLDAPGFGVGDQFIDKDALDTPDRDTIGSSVVACTVTSADVTLLCHAILTLPDGDITLTGAVDGTTGKGTTAITGGTRTYKRIRGDADLVTLSPTLIRLTLNPAS